MGLEWERAERRRKLSDAVTMAYAQAIGDAVSEYDGTDVDLLRAELAAWDVPDNTAPKQRTRTEVA